MAESGIIEIHGKKYFTVAKRVDMFRKDYSGYGIKTDIIGQGQLVTVKAEITDETGRTVATGYAEEDRDRGNINKTSAVENAETSAVGRALAFFGLGGTEIASADEVNDAIYQQGIMEALADVVRHQDCVRDNLESVLAIKVGIATGDIESAAEAWYELDENSMRGLWLATTKGGIFTTKERDIIKSQFSQYKRGE